MAISTHDKLILRELGKMHFEMASDDVQKKMNERMKATNDLKIVRPPVLMDEIPWYQMNMDGELDCRCEDPSLHRIELGLRRNIFRRKHFACDTLFEPFWRVTMAYDSTGIGISAKEEIRRTDSINNIISHSYEDLLEEEGSHELIKIPTFTARPDKDMAALEYYTDIFGDSLPVKLCGRGYLYHAPWDIIARLRGVEPILFDLYDRPEHLHAIRQRFHEVTLAELDFVEKHLEIDCTNPNLHCTPSMASGLDGEKWKSSWFRGMAQCFGDISPDMFKEFEIDYSQKIASKFGYSYYGCCEPLDNKIEVIKEIKNLRKIGVSPWANVERCAEQIKGDFVYSRKPNPANVAISTDPDVIKRETEETVKACIKHNCPCEFVLKDISTVSHKPKNLIVWASTVGEVLDQYYGE